MSRELLKRVLNALYDEHVPNTITNSILIKDILEELAKPVPEPLCYLSNKVGTDIFEQCEPDYIPFSKHWTKAIPVYTSPPRKPLSDDEIDKTLFICKPGAVTDKSLRDFARRIEKAHGIGN